MNPRRAEREALGLSQVAAAKAAGVGIATWRRWEDDPNSVKASTASLCDRALRTCRNARDRGLDLRTTSETEPILLLTVDQVAVKINASRAHVYRLIGEGSLRATDISSVSSRQRTIRVFAPDVDAFLEGRKIGPDAL